MNTLSDWYDEYIEHQSTTIGLLKEFHVHFQTIIDRLCITAEAGHQIFVAGNGGSAAMANHFAIDINKCANDGTPDLGLRCHSLAANASEITAWGNDISFDAVFTAQLERLSRPGDTLIAVSTSGTSPNVVQACRWAKESGRYVIALTGLRAEEQTLVASVLDYCHLALVVPSKHYGRVEDTHSVFLHTIAYAFAEGIALQGPESITKENQTEKYTYSLDPPSDPGKNDVWYELDHDGLLRATWTWNGAKWV